MIWPVDRNYPRDRRYQFFSARLPRDVNCFICNASKLTGLADLPRGSHLVEESGRELFFKLSYAIQR